ncbi:hypothetical protein SAM19_02866 [Brevibacillus laterosporus]|nr:hypothetical protein [Brevibacillus laterosporus]
MAIFKEPLRSQLKFLTRRCVNFTIFELVNDVNTSLDEFRQNIRY